MTINNGDAAKARAYISHAPNTHELFLTFSGTANLEQGLHDLGSYEVRFCPSAWDIEDRAEDKRKVRPHSSCNIVLLAEKCTEASRESIVVSKDGFSRSY